MRNQNGQSTLEALFATLILTGLLLGFTALAKSFYRQRSLENDKTMESRLALTQTAQNFSYDKRFYLEH